MDTLTVLLSRASPNIAIEIAVRHQVHYITQNCLQSEASRAPTSELDTNTSTYSQRSLRLSDSNILDHQLHVRAGSRDHNHLRLIEQLHGRPIK